jgi:hypothetical protein
MDGSSIYRKYSYCHVGQSSCFPQATTGLIPIIYRRALLNTLLHAVVYIFTQVAECTLVSCTLVSMLPRCYSKIEFARKLGGARFLWSME